MKDLVMCVIYLDQSINLSAKNNPWPYSNMTSHLTFSYTLKFNLACLIYKHTSHQHTYIPIIMHFYLFMECTPSLSFLS